MFNWFRKRAQPGDRIGDRSSVVARAPVGNGFHFPFAHNPGTNTEPNRFTRGPVSAAPIYRNMMGPVYYPDAFNGFVGLFHVKAAKVIPLYTRPDYSGILPTREQPGLNKPNPYSDVTGGV